MELVARVARRVRALPVALAARPELVDAPRRARPSARAAVGRGVGAELRGRVRARRAGARCSRGGPSSRARDRAHREPLARRLPGPAAARSAAGRTTAPARCSDCACRAASSPAAPSPTATRCCRRSCGLGTPVRYVPGESTATFSFSYDGDLRDDADRRARRQLAAGRPPRAAVDGWVHVAPLARDEFPAETLAALARRCRVSLDGQGLVRVPELGPLRLDADFDPEVLRHVWVLKLADEEAEVLGDLAALGVREVHRHARVARRDGLLRRHARSCPRARSMPTRPARATRSRPRTSSRATPASRPAGAARRATAVVASMLRADDRRRRHRRRRVRRRPRDGRGRAVGRRRRAARPRPSLNLPRVVAAAAAGSTVVAVVDAKPPLLVSHDAGVDLARVRPRPARRDGRSRSPTTTPTCSSTRRATGSTCRANGGRFWSALARRAAGDRARSSSEAELAARDDDGRAADLDALDPLGRRRRPARRASTGG